MTTQSGFLSPSKMTADSGKKRTKLKDNSWIRRDVEEDEPVDYDPNFGKSVLGRLKSTDDADSPAVNSGPSVNSVTKRFGDSQELNKSSINTTTKSSVTPTSPTKPPVPIKNPAVKTSPNTSSFTARVFSGANTNNKTVNSPVKRSFGEKFPEVTVSQTTNQVEKTFSPAPVSPVMIPPPVSPFTSTSSSIVKTPVSPSPVKSTSRNENLSFSYGSSISSVTTTKRTISSSDSSSLILEDTRSTKPSERSSDDFKLSDVSYSSTYTTPSSETLSTTYYSSQRSSAPLDDLADTLYLSRSGSVQSQPLQSQTHMMSVDQSYSSVYSPTKTSFSEFTSSRSVSSRDVCSVCGKPTTGAAKMILEDLQIFCHTSCFKCAVCHTALGNLEAGKSLWVHRDRVNCSNCYSKIKGQWYI